MTGPSILLPFIDDSTLFFALRMRAALSGHGCRLSLGWLTDSTSLSHRQLAQALPCGPDLLIRNGAFRDPDSFAGFDAIVTSRLFAPLRDMMRRPDVRYRADRPAVVSFQGGLDFTPERGFANRLCADSVFVVPRAEVKRYRDFAARHDLPAQHVDFGHPAFLMPDGRARPDATRDVYFFAQAISPRTAAARRHVLRLLAALARADGTRTVWIKLRHLPGENARHLHTEQHDYPGLLSGLRGVPENLRLTACSMDEALARAGVGLTCTSTAAIDLLREGVPTQIYLDYVQNYRDPMVAPMRRLFQGSGLIASIDDILGGRTTAPDPAWLGAMLCPRDLGARVLAAIDTVRARPLAVQRILSGPPQRSAA